MQAPTAPDVGHRLVRPKHGRRVAGVSAGLGNAFGIDPNLIRIAFVVLAFASAVGVLLYLTAWAVTPSEDASTPAPPRRPRTRSQFVEASALAVIVVGVLLLVRPLRLGFTDQLVWPVLLAGFGAALLWGRFRNPPPPSLDAGATRPAPDNGSTWDAAVASLVGDTRRPSPATIGRIGAGCVLVVVGAAVFLAATSPSATPAREAASALVVFAIGIALVFGPWLLRLSQDLAAERRARVRSQERAEIAAHVHDSVLHTLALVRRSADDPRQVVSLARRQERELRTWLAGGPAVTSDSLAVALDEVAAAVETDFGVPIEIVKVGDCPIDPPLDALVGAAREAMVNAARHSGAASIAVYVEVERDRVTLFVRDRGIGFATAAVDPDRHGVTESIVGRMHRHGGTAEVRSRPGAGTEVELGTPRSGA